MTKATIEMEDAFGMGLYKFLETSGKILTEFTISCGSDDSTLLDGGGRSFELFNVGLKLAGRFCPELTMLSISGCGLVTNGLVRDHSYITSALVGGRGVRKCQFLLILSTKNMLM